LAVTERARRATGVTADGMQNQRLAVDLVDLHNALIARIQKAKPEAVHDVMALFFVHDVLALINNFYSSPQVTEKIAVRLQEELNIR